jgi:hypothetical protein
MIKNDLLLDYYLYFITAWEELKARLPSKSKIDNVHFFVFISIEV